MDTQSRERPLDGQAGSASAARKKIFILGDSRTGTTSLHQFLTTLGYKSIHYFFKESGVTEPEHDDYEANWQRLKLFIDTSGFDAFSDYPLRTFYKDLLANYPDAYFVLSHRKDTATWRRSMVKFFSRFDVDLDMQVLTFAYETLNREIRQIAARTPRHFCEICIDDDATRNGTRLARFLGHEGSFHLGHENSSASFDNDSWSRRVKLYETAAADPLAHVKEAVSPSKAMLSERGWVYLINDPTEFMDYFHGARSWDRGAFGNAVTVLRQRHGTLQKAGIDYLKYAIPEKACVYPEFLPRALRVLPQDKTRPALRLSAADLAYFSYPIDWLTDAKSLGHLYFRGDAGLTWLGAFHLYQKIVEDIEKQIGCGAVRGTARAPIRMRDLTPSIAGYEGDLYGQLGAAEARLFFDAWGNISHGPVCEYLVKYTQDPKTRSAVPVAPGQAYEAAIKDRETLRYVNANRSLPRAVIFRDSTCTHLTDLLAEHFSESLFVWHNGLVYDDVIEREKPDLVLHIMAERLLVHYAQGQAFHHLW